VGRVSENFDMPIDSQCGRSVVVESVSQASARLMDLEGKGAKKAATYLRCPAQLVKRFPDIEVVDLTHLGGSY
jgi:hypothetical protein